MAMRAFRIAAIVLSLCWLTALGQSRVLHWRSVDVRAMLDSEGRLHVSERQAIVFTGDWNGGERYFRLKLGQDLHLDRLVRVDLQTGASHQLVEGDLSQLDNYEWVNDSTLRWRSRLPSDPPFDNTTIVYVLDYTFSNILVPKGEGYLLDHDFCFSDRSGEIEDYSLSLQLDTVWRTAQNLPLRLRHKSLLPGEGVPVSLFLSYPTGRVPAGVRKGAAAPIRYLLIGLLLGGIGFFLGALYLREKSLGRFRPLPLAASIDAAWLEAHVFSMPPEVVGAAWDDKTSAAEVAAVIARMVSEGKLQSSVRHSGSRFKKHVLELKLLADFESLPGYERILTKSLFFEGDTTDTERIQEHYRNRGFDPAQKIAVALERKVKSLISPSRGSTRPTVIRSLGLSSAGLLLMAAGSFFGFEQLVVTAVMSAIAMALYLLALFGALAWGKAIDRLFARALLFVVPVSAFCGGVVYLLYSGAWQLNAGVLSGFTLLSLAMASSISNLAASREDPDRIALRRRLLGARRYFQQELRSKNPNLKDSWFPYLVAFGLGRNVDRWFRAYGGASVDGGGDSSWSQSSSSPSQAGSTSGWTGGGGTFGGAGASGSWAVAAGSLASGVSSPDSGSSGGGSSGGGSSSGGGGGGGW